MHILKLKAHDVKKVLEEHNRRGHSKDGDIDIQKSHMNYNLAPRDITDVKIIKDMIKDKGITRKIKGDAVLCVDCIITKPIDCTASDQDFAKAAYDFCVQHLCDGDESKVLQSYLHLDETNPHLNFDYIPIIKGRSKKKDKESGEIKESEKMKLSAKEQWTKSFMYQLHPALSAFMAEHGIDGTFYDAEKAKDKTTRNMTIAEYKAFKRKESMTKDLSRVRSEAIATINHLAYKEKELTERVEELQAALEEAQTTLSRTLDTDAHIRAKMAYLEEQKKKAKEIHEKELNKAVNRRIEELTDEVGVDTLAELIAYAKDGKAYENEINKIKEEDLEY